MREIRNQKPQKAKPSKFFDQLIQKYGEQFALSKATNAEISDKVRFFIQDLVYGNLLQDKYIRYLLEDTENRLIQTAMFEIEYRYRRSYILVYSLTKMVNSTDPISQSQEFNQCYMDEDMKTKAYSILRAGLTNFINTREPSYIEWIAIQFNSPVLKGAKTLV